MCTIAVALQADRRWPVVIAANRDERLARPAEGWALRLPPGAPPYLAPRDALAGGTWIGLSARGVLAAVTNVHLPDGPGPDPSRRSRGELVALALAHPDAAAARAALPAGTPPWNPFQLLVADAETAFLWRWDGARSDVEALAPGLHVVTEEAAEDRGPRGERVRARWPLEPALPALREVLVQHADGREGTCIHLDPRYGTRSATLLRLGRDLATADLHACEGHPCVAPFEDLGALVRLLAARAAPAPSGGAT